MTTKTLAAKVDARSATLSSTRTATGMAFTGTATWTLQLRAGVYRFGSDPRLSGRLAVS